MIRCYDVGMTDSSSLKNQLLIAMPGLSDPNFAKGVTYICQHNEHGALGLMINRPSEYHLSDVLGQMRIDVEAPEIGEQIVFSGGPVQQDRGFVLHQPSGEWESTFEVTPELSVTTSKDVLEAIARGEGPNQILVALGYAGWAAGQLESEMRDNAWLNATSSTEVLFDTPVEDRWRSAAALMGIDIDTLHGTAGNA